MRQKDGHVLDNKLRHGAEAEKADFFGFEVDSGAGDLERLRASEGDFERDGQTFDLEVAIYARAHEIRLRAVCGCGEEE